ncbi:EAL domain-containing protein [Sphingomonas sp. CFBP 13720]|uniref:EAL domain-containing protein n=1 Tax=Sphingomonas sp. CFBP 13720 TaxID=2775302 RepID=UPI00406CA74F
MISSDSCPPKVRCSGCRDGAALDFAIAMAFQPIVDLTTGLPFAYEALVRGANGESAANVLARVTPDNRYAFDQRCRVAAIEGAVAAGILDTGARLSMNFLPNAVYSPAACIQLTLRTSQATGMPIERLIFEFTENERMDDPAHVATIVDTYRRMGFGTALDDFGAGHAGLNLLARFQPDIVKLDMELVRGIEVSMPRRMIVEAVVRLCESLGLTVVAEGVETQAELDALRAIGIRYIQGYYFARPGFATLPAIRMDSGGERLVA